MPRSWDDDRTGTVCAFGAVSGGPVQPHDLGGSPASGILGTVTGQGYWLVDLRGFVHGLGDAVTYPANP
jgi:hypothetical protein